MEGVFIRSCGTEYWAGRWEWFCEDLPVSFVVAWVRAQIPLVFGVA
jgi:hypothetical protein